MSPQLLPFYFSILIFASCAIPAPISQLSPDKKHDSFWLNGREILSQNNDSLFVELSFYERQNDLYIFDLTVINQSDKTILLDPGSIAYIPITSDGDTLNPVTAVNPERKILEQQMKINKLDAKRKKEAGIALLFGTIELAASVADKENSAESEVTAFDRYEIKASEIDSETAYVTEQKDYWENQTLRKTTLFPEYYISGQVFLRYRKGIKQLGIQIPLAETEFVFWFDHKLIPHKVF